MSEYFVDQATNPIPPADTWENLSTDQLIDVKNRLEEQRWRYAKVPAMAKVLGAAVVRISNLIQQRSSS